jgi:hypothetical protein
MFRRAGAAVVAAASATLTLGAFATPADASTTAASCAARQAGFAEWPDPTLPPGQYYSMRNVHDAHLSFQSDITRQTNDAALSIRTGCSLTTK